MAPDRVNADEVDRRVDRLLTEYGDALTESVREEHAGDFGALRSHADDGYLGGAYCWTVREAGDHPDPSASMPEDAGDDGDRVLLALGRGHDSWGPPGGGREPGEAFEDAAVREVREETGVAARVTDLVGVRRVTVVDPGGDDEVHLAYVVFEAAYAGGSIDVQESEVNGAAWFASLPDPLHPLAGPAAEGWEP